MNVTGQSQDRAYVALLGLAEHFRTTKNIKKAIQCLVIYLHFLFFFLNFKMITIII